MNFVALIGANHAHQYPGNVHGRANQFEDFLTSQVRDLSVDLLAEEMSAEALQRAKVVESSVQRVARELKVPHLLCDPDSIQRSALGIPDFEELKRKRNLKLVVDEDAALLEQDERLYWPVREAEWLRRLQRAEFGRAIFVTGPNHVLSFEDLLRRNSYEVQIITERWEA